MQREDRFLTCVLALVGLAEVVAATAGSDWIAGHRLFVFSISVGVLFATAIVTQIIRASAAAP